MKIEEWMLLINKIPDRIYRIQGPAVYEYLAVGEKNPVYPVNPVKKKFKIGSIQHLWLGWY